MEHRAVAERVVLEYCFGRLAASWLQRGPTWHQKRSVRAHPKTGCPDGVRFAAISRQKSVIFGKNASCVSSLEECATLCARRLQSQLAVPVFEEMGTLEGQLMTAGFPSTVARCTSVAEILRKADVTDIQVYAFYIMCCGLAATCVASGPCWYG